MAGTWRKYTEEILRDAVLHSTSVAGVLRYLGLNQAGGTHAHISRTIKSFGIDTSHFIRHQGGGAYRRRDASSILVRIPFGSKRTDPFLLRRALSDLGRPHECEACGNEGVWQGAPLRLEVDHIDGDYHNNERENLRYLCPNCHTQTANFSGRSRGKYASASDQALLFGPDQPSRSGSLD